MQRQARLQSRRNEVHLTSCRELKKQIPTRPSSEFPGGPTGENGPKPALSLEKSSCQLPGVGDIRTFRRPQGM
ncbi:hypothetical protein CapIbe_007339 [Capra ibex]